MSHKKPGRPALDATAVAPSAAIHLKLPAHDFDRAERLAHDRRESIQELIRRELKRVLDARGDGI